MKTSPRVLAVCVLTVALTTLAPTTSQACYWDKDTLAMERRAFPKLLALIVGRVRTRSAALYRWRVEDRLAKLKKTPKRTGRGRRVSGLDEEEAE